MFSKMAVTGSVFRWCAPVNIIKILNASGSRQLVRSASNSVVDNVETEMNEEDLENEIRNKQNKSRLTPQHRNLLRGEMPFAEPQHWSHETVKYKKRMYGRYGSSTNINPGIMWPTKEQLEEMKEYENLAYPDTLQEMMNNVKTKREDEMIKRKQREETVMKKLEKLEMWKQELRLKQEKKLHDAEVEKQKRERLVEEVRQHFGFTVDPRDERFQEMLAQKEKEARKKNKEAKRKEREKKMAEKLANIGADATKESQSGN